MMMKKKIIPLPLNYYFLPMIAIAICGFLASTYLSISHYRVYTDISYKSFCAISKSINCDTVSQSKYSIFIDVPVPIWGVISYALFLSLLLFARHRKADKKRMWSILMIIAACYSIYSIILAAISTFYIHSYCIMCIVTYGVNFLLLFYAWLIKKRFDNTGLIQGLTLDIRFLWKMRFSTSTVIILFLLCFSLCLIFFPKYWNISIPSVSVDIPQGITEDGHPWIGAKNPELVITEFTDYRCFQCKKMHYYLRGLIASYPEKIRLIHRHYPMDHEFNEIVKKPLHVGSGKLSLLAIYAAENGKFWEMNDLLFNLNQNKKEFNTKSLAQKIGLDPRGLATSLHNRIIRKKLQIDIWKGMKLRITGTPGYLIDGKVYLANIPPEIIESALH